MRRLMFVSLAGLIGLVAASSGSACAGVRVHAYVDKPVVLAGCDQTVVVKIGLSSLDGFFPRERLPLNISIVVDKSGSMRADNKIGNARLGAIEVVERMSRDDILSLVVYDSAPRVVIPAQRVRDKDALIEIISSIGAGGSTALYGGVCFGASEVRKNMCGDCVNRIILLSDGLANVGPRSTQELARLGTLLGKEGITITTIGVGLDYNEDLMTALADRSGGNAYFANTGSELPKIFAEEIGESMMLVARDIRIGLDCRHGAKPVSVLGRGGVISGQNMAVMIGNLYGSNEKYALFEIQVPQEGSGESVEVARVTVEYSDTGRKGVIEETQAVTIAYHSDARVVAEQERREIVKEAALARTSELKRKAVDLADRGDYERAAGLIKKNALALEKIAEQCDNDKELLGEAEMCQEISADISLNKGMTRYQRKRVVNQAYTQTTQQGFVSEESQE